MQVTSQNRLLSVSSAWLLGLGALLAASVATAEWTVHERTATGVLHLAAAPAPLPDTGQRGCFDTAGASIGCGGTGQDAEFQHGVDRPAPRFKDNGDGTVTDLVTGLIWLADSTCLGPSNWTLALKDANTLADPSCGLSDASVPGDWRLPNLRELLSLLDYGASVPALPPGHPFNYSLLTNTFLSATTYPGSANLVWAVDFSSGRMLFVNKADPAPLWPVRGGP